MDAFQDVQLDLEEPFSVNEHILSNNATLYFLGLGGRLSKYIQESAAREDLIEGDPSTLAEAVAKALLTMGDDATARIVSEVRATKLIEIRAEQERERAARRAQEERERNMALQILRADMRRLANALMGNLRTLKESDAHKREREEREKNNEELSRFVGERPGDKRRRKATHDAGRSLVHRVIQSSGSVLTLTTEVDDGPDLGTTNSDVALLVGVRNEGGYAQHTVRIDKQRVATLHDWDVEAHLSKLMVDAVVTDTGHVMRILRIGANHLFGGERASSSGPDEHACLDMVTEQLVSLRNTNEIFKAALRISAGPNNSDTKSWMTIDFAGQVEYNVSERAVRDLPKVVALERVGGTLVLNLVPKVVPAGRLPSLPKPLLSTRGDEGGPSSSTDALLPDEREKEEGEGAGEEAVSSTRRRRTRRATVREFAAGGEGDEPSIVADWRNPKLSVPPNEVWIEDVETFQPALLTAFGGGGSLWTFATSASASYTEEQALHAAAGSRPYIKGDRDASADPSLKLRIYRDQSGNRPSSFYPQIDFVYPDRPKARQQDKHGNFKHILIANLVANWIVRQPTAVMRCKYAGRRMLELLLPAAVQPSEEGSYVKFDRETPDKMWIGPSADALVEREIALGYGMEAQTVSGRYVSTGDRRLKSWDTGHVGQLLNIMIDDHSKIIMQVPNPYHGRVRHGDRLEWATNVVRGEVLGASVPAAPSSLFGLPEVPAAPFHDGSGGVQLDLPSPLGMGASVDDEWFQFASQEGTTSSSSWGLPLPPLVPGPPHKEDVQEQSLSSPLGRRPLKPTPLPTLTFDRSPTSDLHESGADEEDDYDVSKMDDTSDEEERDVDLFLPSSPASKASPRSSAGAVSSPALLPSPGLSDRALSVQGARELLSSPAAAAVSELGVVNAFPHDEEDDDPENSDEPPVLHVNKDWSPHVGALNPGSGFATHVMEVEEDMEAYLDMLADDPRQDGRSDTVDDPQQQEPVQQRSDIFMDLNKRDLLDIAAKLKMKEINDGVVPTKYNQALLKHIKMQLNKEKTTKEDLVHYIVELEDAAEP